MLDLLITNARLIDPAAGLNAPGAIGIYGKRIVPAHQDDAAKSRIEADGCLVTPGLVDFHMHLFDEGSEFGVPADLACIPSGVCAAVDAGSAGMSNYRSLRRNLLSCRVKTRSYLNIAPMGITCRAYAEKIFPERWDAAKLEDVFADCPELIGLKLRISDDVLGGRRQLFFDVMSLAGKLGLPVNVHIADTSLPMEEVLARLREGDVVSHLYHGRKETILDEKARVKPCVWEARKRGVLFDSAEGAGNISYDVLRHAMAQGLAPDIISTDITNYSWNHHGLTLCRCMGKYLALGMKLPDVLRCVTATPARKIGLSGALKEGMPADISILRLRRQEERHDNFHTEASPVIAARRFIPMATIVDGQLLYRADDLRVNE